jgi:hypothetical protein
VSDDVFFVIAHAVFLKMFCHKALDYLWFDTQIKFEKPFLILHFVGLTSHIDNNADSPSSMGVDRHTRALHTAVAHGCL